MLHARIDMKSTRHHHEWDPHRHFRMNFAFSKESDFYSMRPDHFVMYGKVEYGHFNETRMVKGHHWELDNATAPLCYPAWNGHMMVSNESFGIEILDNKLNR